MNFGLKKSKKGSKTVEFWFFCHKRLKFYATYLKFCIETPLSGANERKKKLTKFLNILRTNGKSSKNEKSKFCKNLQIRLFLAKSCKNFNAVLKTNLHRHINLYTKFHGTAITIRYKKNLKSLEK